jgi:hypothetical protein
LSSFFPYKERKNDPHRIAHNITVGSFMVLFFVGVILLQIKLFFTNPYMIGFSLSLTLAGTIVGGLLFVKAKKPTAIIEFIFIFIVSWWLLFFSVAQFFL